MSEHTHTQGYFRSGIPYNQLGHGQRILVIFLGLVFENKPMDEAMVKECAEIYGSLLDTYTVYIVPRKPGMPQGYSLTDMAEDYARMIREEFRRPGGCTGPIHRGLHRPAFRRRSP